MDGNDLGMIARVFMFLLKGLKFERCCVRVPEWL